MTVVAARTQDDLDALAERTGAQVRQVDATDVAALARSAAATYGGRGIRVNAVAPGLVRAAMTDHLTADEQQAEASRAMPVLGRLGQVRPRLQL